MIFMQNRNINKILPFLFLTILFISCDKAKNKKWIAGTIEVRSAVTGELIEANIELQYLGNFDSYGNPTELVVEPLGVAENGFFEFKKKIDPDITDYEVYAYTDEKYHGRPNLKLKSETEYISNWQENNITLLLEPIYYLDVYLTNESCYDESDDLNFQYQDPDSLFSRMEIFKGCIENQKTAGPIWSKNPYYQLRWISTKNGISTNVSQKFDLDFGKVNEINIAY